VLAREAKFTQPIPVDAIDPQDLVARASHTIDVLMEREPPGADVRGNHFYWPTAVNAPSLLALLTESPAFSLAESLTGPGTLEVPWQVQVALNIPPFPHRPGMHHIDGAPPEPGGRPGTFTLLAGVLMSDQLDEDAGNLWQWTMSIVLGSATLATSIISGISLVSKLPGMTRGTSGGDCSATSPPGIRGGATRRRRTNPCLAKRPPLDARLPWPHQHPKVLSNHMVGEERLCQ